MSDRYRRVCARFVPAIVYIAAAPTVGGAAASVLDFDKWMQRIERSCQAVQKDLQRADAAAALSDAQEIQRLYVLLESYFADKAKYDDALHLSREGRERAEQVVAAITTNDLTSAARAAAQITRDCRECHNEFKPLEP